MLDDKTVAFLLNSVGEVSLTGPDSEYVERMTNDPDRFSAKPGVRYLGFVFHATVPLVNKKSMGITLPTQQASLATAIDQLIDYEHLAEDFGRADSTNAIGHICDIWFSKPLPTDKETDWLVDGIIPRFSVLTRGIMALYTRKKEVNELFESIVSGEDWYFSLEAGEHTPPAIWLVGNGVLPHVIIPFDEAERELQEIALSCSPELFYKGQRVVYLLGGASGRINYVGGALTKYPAGLEQTEGNQLKALCSINVVSDKSLAVWSKLSDVPENLRVMDGAKLTLAQINYIVRIAEAVERENKNVNGWAVAKARFKENYVKVGDRWVKKASSVLTAAVWDTEYINDLPDSSFAVIEGDYKTGKTKDKRCRHLPFKDKDGNVDLPHLRNAFARVNQIKAVSGPETDAELREKALETLNKYRKYLKGESSTEPVCLFVETFNELYALFALCQDLIGDDIMPKSFTDEEWEAEVKRIGEASIASAIQAGSVIPSDIVKETMISKEEHERLLALYTARKLREYKIASLPLDNDTKEELLILATSDRYPFTEEGERMFEDTCKKWRDRFAIASADGDKKVASTLENKETNFDPGTGWTSDGPGNLQKLLPGSVWD